MCLCVRTPFSLPCVCMFVSQTNKKKKTYLFFLSFFFFLFFLQRCKYLFDVNIFVYIKKNHMLNQNYKHSMYKQYILCVCVCVFYSLDLIIFIYIYIYIYMRWIKITFGVTLKSYTFSKSLDLSRSNG